MRITKSRLKKIIREEHQKLQEFGGPAAHPRGIEPLRKEQTIESQIEYVTPGVQYLGSIALKEGDRDLAESCEDLLIAMEQALRKQKGTY